MAEKKQKSNTKKAEKQAAASAPKKVQAKPIPEQKEVKQEQPKRSSTYLAVGILVILALFIIYVLFFALPSISGVSFATFKSNLDSASRIAVTVTYTNSSQLSAETPCYIRLLEVLSGTRGASSIDFYIVNQTKCTYSPTGLGHVITPTVQNASTCLATADSEPGIFLNYSNSNTTLITPYRLHISANASYYNSCPIATEFA